MFSCVNHDNEPERIGAAQGLGYAAATHLDNVIARLQHAIKSMCHVSAKPWLECSDVCGSAALVVVFVCLCGGVSQWNRLI